MVDEAWIEKQKIRFDSIGTWHFNTGRGQPLLSDKGVNIVDYGPNQVGIFSADQEEYDIVPIIDTLKEEYGIDVKNLDYHLFCPLIRGH